MEERRFQSGEFVIEEGGPGDFFYVTGSGELEVRYRHWHDNDMKPLFYRDVVQCCAPFFFVVFDTGIR